MTPLNLRDIRERCENPSAEFLEKVTNFSGYTYTGLEFIDPFELSKSFANEFNLLALLDWVERARPFLLHLRMSNQFKNSQDLRNLLSELEP